jgi:molybdate transport system permease protein
VTVAEAKAQEWTGNLGNRLFSAILSSILLLFLAGTAMVLISNIWYIHIARNIEYPQSGEFYKTGWQCFVATLKEPETHFAIRLSVVTAFLTAIISMLVAIPSAYLLSRYRAGRGSAGVRIGQYVLVALIAAVIGGFRVWRWSWEVVAVAALLCFILLRYRLSLIDVVDTLVDLPIVMPPPVVGISLLFLFSTPAGTLVNHLTPQPVVHALNAFLTMVTGHEIVDDGSTWVYTTRGIVMAQFFVACAFGMRAVKATFDTIGTRHEDVARTLGCTRRQAFFKVVLPMATTGLVAGTVMTWARAIAEFGPVLFFAGSTSMKTEVMPIGMFLRYSSSEIEKAVALVVIMIAISALTLLTFKKMGGKGYLW